jgi:hypothetical protein
MDAQTREPTGWVGFVVFAGVMLFMVGTFNAIYGLVALFRDEYLAVTPAGLVVWDVTTWGWITLTLGVLQVGAGMAILAGQTWGRIIGVIFAVLNAIGQLPLVSAHPIWSTIIIALDVFVITPCRPRQRDSFRSAMFSPRCAQTWGHV